METMHRHSFVGHYLLADRYSVIIISRTFYGRAIGTVLRPSSSSSSYV